MPGGKGILTLKAALYRMLKMGYKRETIDLRKLSEIWAMVICLHEEITSKDSLWRFGLVAELLVIWLGAHLFTRNSQ